MAERSPGTTCVEFGLSESRRGLMRAARVLAEGPVRARAAEIDRSEEYPWDNVALLVEAGLAGMTVPKRYGGGGRDWLDAVLVVEELARHCAVTARIAVETNLGAVAAIMAYGTDAQKRLAARLVLAGDKPAICITEPDAGSAASEMTTRAELRQDRYVINGMKHWITGGGVSRLHLVFARVFEGGEERGIGSFLAIRGETPGLRIGRREPTMGLRGMPETEVFFEDMEVSKSMMLKPPRGLKKGFADLMTAYNSQRVGAAAVPLGIAEGAFRLAVERVGERRQFGRPICEFQGLQWKLADMSVGLAAARGMVRAAALSGEGRFPDRTLAAQAKILSSETAVRVVNDALQLFGASGYSRNWPLERMARDVRMFTIGGGTAEILRNTVASGILGRPLPQSKP